MALLDLADGALGEAGLIPTRVIEIHVKGEPPREQAIGQCLVALERRELALLLRDSAATEVDTYADAGAVHDGHRALEQRFRGADVLVKVDEAALRTPLLGRLIVGSPDHQGGEQHERRNEGSK